MGHDDKRLDRHVAADEPIAEDGEGGVAVEVCNGARGKCVADVDDNRGVADRRWAGDMAATNGWWWQSRWRRTQRCWAKA